MTAEDIIRNYVVDQHYAGISCSFRLNQFSREGFMAKVQPQVLQIGTLVVVNDGSADEGRGAVCDVQPEQYLVRFSNG